MDAQHNEPDDIDMARSQAAGLLAVLLARPPGPDLLDALRGLHGDASPWGQVVNRFTEAAGEANSDDVAREYNRVFIGLQRGELVPYASYYLTGFLHDRPLMTLRTEMARLGIARAEGVGEPEDHIAAILGIYSGLIAGRFGAPAGPAEQRAFLDRHLSPWAPLFFSDLEKAESARFYKAVGYAGGVLMEIETDAHAFVD